MALGARITYSSFFTLHSSFFILHSSFFIPHSVDEKNFVCGRNENGLRTKKISSAVHFRGMWGGWGDGALFHDEGVVALGEVFVGHGEVLRGDGDVALDGTVGIGEPVGEEPFVGLGQVEDAGEGAVGGSGHPVVAEAFVVVLGEEFVDDALRLLDAYGAVGGAVENPERQLTETLPVLECGSAAEGHAGGDAVWIGAAEVHRAVAAEAHAEDIDACGVAAVVVEGPVEDFEEFFGFPGSAGVLGSDDDGWDFASHLYGLQGSVAAHAVEVVSAEAGSVEEIDDGAGVAEGFIVFGGVDPEVVVAGQDVSLGVEGVGLCAGCEGQAGEGEHSQGVAECCSEGVFLCHWIVNL